MRKQTEDVFYKYKKKYSFINQIEKEILLVYELLDKTFSKHNKVLVCGNGGSSADADHIAGELLKGFVKKRPLMNKLDFLSFGLEGEKLAEKLQEALPVINLSAHTSLITAVINDIGGDEIYAQQVVAYGQVNDVLLGISTSGNSKNIINAAIVAKIKGMYTIGLTGADGGRMNQIFDYLIHVPASITSDIQDMHSAVYHCLCEMLEVERWDY